MASDLELSPAAVERIAEVLYEREERQRNPAAPYPAVAWSQALPSKRTWYHESARQVTAALRLDDPEPLAAWLFTEFAHRLDPQIAWVNVTGYRRDLWLGKARAAINALLAKPEEAEDED